MIYTRTPTLASPVDLTDAKEHLRVSYDDEDLAIQCMILAAARELEAYGEIALTRQTISLAVHGRQRPRRPATGSYGASRLHLRQPGQHGCEARPVPAAARIAARYWRVRE